MSSACAPPTHSGCERREKDAVRVRGMGVVGDEGVCESEEVWR